MTVAELIARLSTLDPTTKVVSFHEEAPPPMQMLQDVHGADLLALGEHKMVVLQGRKMTPEWLKPSTP